MEGIVLCNIHKYIMFRFSTGSSWLKVTPFGIRGMVNWIRKEYGDVPIYITENGVSDVTGTLEDHQRVYYYQHYTNELLKGSLDWDVEL